MEDARSSRVISSPRLWAIDFFVKFARLFTGRHNSLDKVLLHQLSNILSCNNKKKKNLLEFAKKKRAEEGREELNGKDEPVGFVFFLFFFLLVFAFDISCSLVGSSHTLRWPHLKRDIASRFWTLKLVIFVFLFSSLLSCFSLLSLLRFSFLFLQRFRCGSRAVR
jgi:hypothetical protein